VSPTVRAPATADEAKPYFDSREPARTSGRAAALGSKVRTAQTDLRRSLGGEAVVDVDALTGTPRVIQRLDGTITGPAGGDPAAIARGWVRANRAAMGLSEGDVDGLELVERTTTPGDRLTHLRFQQRYRGVPAFDNGLRISLDSSGRILSVSGSPLSDPTVASTRPEVGPRAALRALQRNVGVAGQAEVRSGPEGPRRETTFAGGDFARLVLFGAADGARLAWHVTYQATSTAYYDAVVDANTGAVLYRQNLTKFADATVFPDYPGAENDPNPDKAAANAPRDVDFAALGWLAPGANQLKGPFAHVYTDINDDNTPQPSELIHPSSGDDFLYPFTEFAQPPGEDDACEWDPPAPPGWVPPIGKTARCSWDPTAPASWQVNREQTSTQAFYFANVFHDHLARPTIGFTDATDGFGGNGSGQQDDFVELNANDGADTAGDGGPDGDHINNANMSTPPDGQSPLMQNYLFAFNPAAFFTFRNINGDDDASTVWHEYTHGLSNRLVVNDDGSGALSSPHSGAMGEAWSDWYALDLLHRDGLEIDNINRPGEVDIGVYSDAVFTSTRFSPADCPPNAITPFCPGGISTGIGGYTFGDFGKVFVGPEVHSDGEIWLQTLWDLRTALLLATGSEQVASNRSERLVTEAMRLSPPEPSFLDERNAILAADQGITGGNLRDLIWRVFAGRGMGFYASVADSSDVTPIEDFNVPPDPDAPTATVSGTVTSADTGLPLEGITVGFGGHTTDPTFPDTLSDTTDADGHYSFEAPAGRYGELVFKGAAGFDQISVESVNLSPDENEVHDESMRRDWAASKGGATIEGSDDTGGPFGCGLAQVIDQSQGAGWSPFNPDSADPDNPHAGPPTATITLPRPVDISTVGMDPSNTCGDDPSATTKDYRIETSTDGTNFQVAKEASFTPEDRARLNMVTLNANSTGVVKIRLTLLSPQSAGPGDSGADFIDFSEFEVFGGPPNALPAGTLQASPSSVALGAPVSFDASSFTDADSKITGYDWDFDSDGTVDRTTAEPQTEFTYDRAGDFNATVAVKDFRGGAGTATAAVKVKPGPAVDIPKKGRKGKFKIEITCGSPPCDVNGKLELNFNTARKLNRRGLKIAKFKGTQGSESHRFTLKVPKDVRRDAKDIGLKRLKVRTTVKVSDSAGHTTRARGKTKVGI
jgi:hypothetical protein